MMWGYGWGFSWVGWIFMLLMWFLIVAGVIWLVRGVFDPRDAGYHCARRILDERFAAGEITAEEYESRRRYLR